MVPGSPRQLRDIALRRLLRAKRWILTVSLALTGAFTGLAANAFPGKTIKTQTPASGATSKQSPAQTSSSTGTSTEGTSSSLKAPEQAPQAAEQPEPGSSSSGGSSSGEAGASQPAPEAPVVSGGS